MTSVVVKNSGQSLDLPNTKLKPTAVAAVLYGKYIAAGTTRSICGGDHHETDHYMAWFNRKVSSEQFELIAKTITGALEKNTAVQVSVDPKAVFECNPEIKIEPANDEKDHLIHVMLSVHFKSIPFDGEPNNPRHFREEFGRQVCEVFARARSGQLDYEEPCTPLLKVRIAAAKLGRKFVK